MSLVARLLCYHKAKVDCTVYVLNIFLVVLLRFIG